MERKVYVVITEGGGEWQGSQVNKVFMTEAKATQYCEEMNYKKFLEVYKANEQSLEKTIEFFLPIYADFDIVKERVYDLEKTEINFDNLSFEDFLYMQTILKSFDKEEDIYFKTEIALYKIKETDYYT